MVDLDASFGYFTIPFIKGGASHVHACEMNPNSIAALRRNLAANAAASSCTVCVQHTSHTRRSIPCSTCISLYCSLESDNQALHALQTVSASVSCPLPTQACLWLCTCCASAGAACMFMETAATHSKASGAAAR